MPGVMDTVTTLGRTNKDRRLDLPAIRGTTTLAATKVTHLPRARRRHRLPRGRLGAATRSRGKPRTRLRPDLHRQPRGVKPSFNTVPAGLSLMDDITYYHIHDMLIGLLCSRVRFLLYNRSTVQRCWDAMKGLVQLDIEKGSHGTNARRRLSKRRNAETGRTGDHEI
jgi:hypothetical protein